MKKRYLILFAAVLMWAADCRHTEPETGTLEINFKGSFGGEPLMMYADDYPYPDNMQVKWQLFQFFLSDIDLLSSGGKTEAKEVDQVNFGSVQSADAAAAGITLVLTDVPIGEYTGIQLGMGVNEDLNKTKPADHSAKDPLGSAANYWTDAGSYIFTKLEGNADLNGDGDFSDAKLTFHIGNAGGYRTKSWDKAISIKSNQTTRINFTVDMLKALSDGQGNFINFRETTQVHGGNAEIAVFIQDRLLNESLELK
ncbi:MAG: hypothetical protein H6562_22865 [Lewinellaceae bacterium]|nr:hypothetical protein [Lewinella sp.]MCB9281750.1 hypothetical protein [Lewinellaceae bacterium]